MVWVNNIDAHGVERNEVDKFALKIPLLVSNGQYVANICAWAFFNDNMLRFDWL